MRVGLIRGSLLRTYEAPSYEIEGADVTIFASRNNSAASSLPVRRLPALSDVTALAGPRVAGATYYFAGSLEYLFGLERALEGHDIAHALELSNPFTLQAVRARQRGAVKRVVATVMENIPFQPDQNPLVVRRARFLARQVDHFLAITEPARVHLQLAGVPDERISVLPLGIDMERFRPADTTVRPSGAPLRVVTVSRLEPAKGVEDLVVAAGLLARRGIPVDLRLVGSGPLRPKLERIASEMGIGAHVRFDSVPWEEIERVYRDADVFVLASAATRLWREQFGFAVVEAMACGLPVVVGDSGSLPDVVGRADSLVRPHDAVALADRLQHLAQHPEERGREAEENRARALERWDVQSIRRRLGETYEHVLARPPVS
jgi:glycosyltransferase involved in cell wall biosynthesis